METYSWYDKCSCGGDYEGVSGIVFDTFPSSHPVRCCTCKAESRSFPLEETQRQGWGEPKWMKKKE